MQDDLRATGEVPSASATACAVRPPIPASISSKTIVARPPPRAPRCGGRARSARARRRRRSRRRARTEGLDSRTIARRRRGRSRSARAARRRSGSRLPHREPGGAPLTPPREPRGLGPGVRQSAARAPARSASARRRLPPRPDPRPRQQPPARSAPRRPRRGALRSRKDAAALGLGNPLQVAFDRVDAPWSASRPSR